jgi:hypothetical protein
MFKLKNIAMSSQEIIKLKMILPNSFQNDSAESLMPSVKSAVA